MSKRNRRQISNPELRGSKNGNSKSNESHGIAPTEEKRNSRKKHLSGEQNTSKKKPKITQSRLHGLYNQGQTCYLSSVLQVLFMTTELHDRLDRHQQTDLQLRKIFETLKETECETKEITNALGIKNVNEQQDAAECLENILRKISPKASQVFHGKLQYKTTCSKGHTISETTSPFWSLPLSLKDTADTSYSVKIGFDAFFQTKQFEGEDKAYCDTCDRKREATSECEMVGCPQVLTLLLKRFYFDHGIMSYVKEDCCVDVPLTLQTKNKEYSLYGLVNHRGDLTRGHYTASVLSSEDKTWYEFNDTHVEKAQEQPSAESGIYRSSAAYLLMYRGREIGCDTSSQQNRRQDKTSKTRLQLSTLEVEAQYHKKEMDVQAPLNTSRKMNKSKNPRDWKRGEDPQQIHQSSRGNKCRLTDRLIFFILLVSIFCLLIITLVIFLKSF